MFLFYHTSVKNFIKNRRILSKQVADKFDIGYNKAIKSITD
ncbi:hypothetical protein SORDD14_01531 [Streptococcus oralis]|uniref:Uncharacterized protein n=1 Tax=Streptococcus oralis TaxID=1303 RepID=A0A139NV49_STROR|nr:hypothetical protein SORDD14_01531 [Streptococcus oralis]